jgi:hypothetical protein
MGVLEGVSLALLLGWNIKNTFIVLQENEILNVTHNNNVHWVNKIQNQQERVNVLFFKETKFST